MMRWLEPNDLQKHRCDRQHHMQQDLASPTCKDFLQVGT
ncbi:hypothetical protein APA386B_370 [Acetobacter pasteurianus 386B]|nr:hypothetical protein APA386B_370 [Acetobacter pasteurianus 386B]